MLAATRREAVPIDPIDKGMLGADGVVLQSDDITDRAESFLGGDAGLSLLRDSGWIIFDPMNRLKWVCPYDVAFNVILVIYHDCHFQT